MIESTKNILRFYSSYLSVGQAVRLKIYSFIALMLVAFLVPHRAEGARYFDTIDLQHNKFYDKKLHHYTFSTPEEEHYAYKSINGTEKEADLVLQGSGGVVTPGSKYEWNITLGKVNLSDQHDSKNKIEVWSGANIGDYVKGSAREYVPTEYRGVQNFNIDLNVHLDSLYATNENSSVAVNFDFKGHEHNGQQIEDKKTLQDLKKNKGVVIEVTKGHSSSKYAHKGIRLHSGVGEASFKVSNSNVQVNGSNVQLDANNVKFNLVKEDEIKGNSSLTITSEDSHAIMLNANNNIKVVLGNGSLLDMKGKGGNTGSVPSIELSGLKDEIVLGSRSRINGNINFKEVNFTSAVVTVGDKNTEDKSTDKDSAYVNGKITFGAPNKRLGNIKLVVLNNSQLNAKDVSINGSITNLELDKRATLQVNNVDKQLNVNGLFNTVSLHSGATLKDSINFVTKESFNNILVYAGEKEGATIEGSVKAPFGSGSLVVNGAGTLNITGTADALVGFNELDLQEGHLKLNGRLNPGDNLVIKVRILADSAKDTQARIVTVQPPKEVTTALHIRGGSENLGRTGEEYSLVLWQFKPNGTELSDNFIKSLQPHSLLYKIDATLEGSQPKEGGTTAVERSNRIKIKITKEKNFIDVINEEKNSYNDLYFQSISHYLDSLMGRKGLSRQEYDSLDDLAMGTKEGFFEFLQALEPVSPEIYFKLTDELAYKLSNFIQDASPVKFQNNNIFLWSNMGYYKSNITNLTNTYRGANSKNLGLSSNGIMFTAGAEYAFGRTLKLGGSYGYATDKGKNNFLDFSSKGTYFAIYGQMNLTSNISALLTESYLQNTFNVDRRAPSLEDKNVTTSNPTADELSSRARVMYKIRLGKTTMLTPFTEGMFARGRLQAYKENNSIISQELASTSSAIYKGSLGLALTQIVALSANAVLFYNVAASEVYSYNKLPSSYVIKIENFLKGQNVSPIEQPLKSGGSASTHISLSAKYMMSDIGLSFMLGVQPTFSSKGNSIAVNGGINLQLQ